MDVYVEYRLSMKLIGVKYRRFCLQSDMNITIFISVLCNLYIFLIIHFFSAQLWSSRSSRLGVKNPHQILGEA